MDYNRHVCLKDLENYLKKAEYLGGYTFGHGFKGRYQGENGEIFD